MAKADPVRVVEDVRAAEALDQRRTVGELERRDLSGDVLGAGALGMIRQSLDPSLLSEQPPGNEPACEAERPRDDVEAPLLHQPVKRESESGHRPPNPAGRAR